MNRRGFLAASTLGVAAQQAGVLSVLLAPREARAQRLPFAVLTAGEARAAETLGEFLVPGAAQAGLTHYLDQHLAAAPADSLLMIRYLDVPPPYLQFYRPCLQALDTAARRQHGKPLHESSAEQLHAFVAALQQGSLQEWQAPPAPLFYFLLRADAVDVVYGTREGFAKLGVPYMQHIMPSSNW